MRHNEVFGAYSDSNGSLRYTENARCWFDLSLISSYGREEGDRLKFLNRRSYQQMIFDGLGLEFLGEQYLLPKPIETELAGDVAIAAEAGHVWPMKKWAYYEDLKQRLEQEGLVVNVLPKRSSLLEHLADVRNHRCLVSGDSLPMHFAFGDKDALCGPFHLHEPVGNLRLRHSDEDCFAVARAILLRTRTTRSARQPRLAWMKCSRL